MIRFYVRNEEQHDALLESIKSCIRTWGVNGSYIEELEEPENVEGIVRWCSYFLDKFSVTPCPVYWNLNTDEVEWLKWIFKEYCDANIPPFSSKKFKIIKELVREIKDNFSKVA